MRVVIDTNVMVSRYINPNGSPAEVLTYWREGAYELVVSEPILDEYARVLRYDTVRRLHRLTDEEIVAIIAEFREFAEVLEPTELLQVVEADPSDDMFFECAVAGDVEIIVSGDPHVQRVGAYRGIQVLSPAEFLAFLRTGERVADG